MSASRQKKLRQEQAASATTTKRRAVTEEEKAAKRLKIWSAVFYVIIGLMVIGIAVAAIANTGVLERTLTAVTIGNHKLTAAELNYYYLATVNNTMSSNSMMSYMVTSGTPLDEQGISAKALIPGPTTSWILPSPLPGTPMPFTTRQLPRATL